MKNKDLFGNESIIKESTKGSKYTHFDKLFNYRKGEGSVKSKNCKHLIKKVYSKTYYNCELRGIASSEAAEIRVNNVCDQFKQLES